MFIHVCLSCSSVGAKWKERERIWIEENQWVEEAGWKRANECNEKCEHKWIQIDYKSITSASLLFATLLYKEMNFTVSYRQITDLQIPLNINMSRHDDRNVANNN